MEKKRIYWIDALKGFATIFVVIGHIFDGYIKAGLFESNRDFLSYGFKIIYGFHMPLFFIVSGYVFQMAYIKDGKKKPNLKKQIINILIIYVVFSILLGLFKIIMGRYTNVTIDYMDLLLIPVKTITPYWYLYALLAFYLIFSSKLILSTVKKEYIILISLLVINILSIFLNNEIGAYFEIYHITYMALFFYTGALLCKKSVRLADKWYLVTAFFVASVVLMVIFRNCDGRYSSIPFANIVIAGGISLALCMFFQSFCNKGNQVHVKFLSFIGRYSLEIYLIHCVFTAGNRVVLSKLHIDNFYLNIFMNFVISLGLPIIISVICRKIRIYNILFRPVTYIIKDK